MISASHNPFADNGIKFFSAGGAKLPDDVEFDIERQMDAPLVCAPAAELGKAFRVGDAPGRYIEFCKSTFPNELDLRGCRIVVDCALGGYVFLLRQIKARNLERRSKVRPIDAAFSGPMAASNVTPFARRAYAPAHRSHVEAPREATILALRRTASW